MPSSAFGFKFSLTLFLPDLKCRCQIPVKKAWPLHQNPHPSGGNDWNEFPVQLECRMNLDEPFEEERTMKTTLSVIKADVGSIGGHIQPSKRLVEEVKNFVGAGGKGMVTDSYISYTGDDIAILMAHSRGKGDEKIHQLAWDAFVAGTRVAKEQGLYGAGQDLLKDSFSGNMK